MASPFCTACGAAVTEGTRCGAGKPECRLLVLEHKPDLPYN